MELGTIRHINIETEMQASYLDYAMSVIVARALPDVRDGLKPVHRRILYAMHDLGLSHDKPYKKSARIVGEVLGKYHPHGDVAVYEAMVRMAQEFSLRYPLVDGQGNFGSIDGDNAAAMRYTEARLAAIAGEMLADIHKDTVEWTDNFDGTLREPAVLPAALPSLLVNGASGIAVGMSTNIPPHNLGEVCDALCYLIDNDRRIEEVTTEDLMQFIPGPDFPTGGVAYRYHTEGNGGEDGNYAREDVIAKTYASGRGRIVVQAKAHIEEMSRSRNRIVVTELPYQVNKTSLLERIAELARDGRIEGITDLRDESDRTGMRICIEMTRTVDPKQVLGQLFKLTPLESTFGVSLLALVDGEPRFLGLKRILQHYLEHRQEVILRRGRHDLEKARQRAHILEGLLRALDVLDEVIALIRRSRTADTAKQNLIAQFKFTDAQAQAILDMQLRRLAALERRKLEDEYRETLALIRELEELLASPQKVLALIRQNLIDLKTRYGDSRRTQIADRVKGTLTAMDVLPDQEVWITLGADGTLARRPREPLPASTIASLVQDASLALLTAHTRHDLYLFSAKGQATRVPIHQIPEAPGVHFADISGFGRRDRIAALCSIPKPQTEEPVPGYLLLGTAQGKVKRVTLADLSAQAPANPQVIGLEAGDELVWADVSQGEGEILLVTALGQAIRFSVEDVRPMGLPAGGVSGIKLQAKDLVVAGQGTFGKVLEPGARLTALAIITTTGYGKRVPLDDFPVQGRGGQGVVVAKSGGRLGEIAGAALASSQGIVACLLDTFGPARALPAADLPLLSRSAQGKPLLSLASQERVWHLYAVAGEGAPARAPLGLPWGSRGQTPAPGEQKPEAKPSIKAGVVSPPNPAPTAQPLSPWAGRRPGRAGKGAAEAPPGLVPEKAAPTPKTKRAGKAPEATATPPPAPKTRQAGKAPAVATPPPTAAKRETSPVKPARIVPSPAVAVEDPQMGAETGSSRQASKAAPPAPTSAPKPKSPRPKTEAQLPLPVASEPVSRSKTTSAQPSDITSQRGVSPPTGKGVSPPTGKGAPSKTTKPITSEPPATAGGKTYARAELPKLAPAQPTTFGSPPPSAPDRKPTKREASPSRAEPEPPATQKSKIPESGKSQKTPPPSAAPSTPGKRTKP